MKHPEVQMRQQTNLHEIKEVSVHLLKFPLNARGWLPRIEGNTVCERPVNPVSNVVLLSTLVVILG